MSVAHERDYLERTIATVRNHREADNCWPQWANIFADEIERLWKLEDAAESARHSLEMLRFHEGNERATLKWAHTVNRECAGVLAALAGSERL